MASSKSFPLLDRVFGEKPSSPTRSRYKAISASAFRSAMESVRLRETTHPGVAELVYERQVEAAPRFTVAVFSSVHITTKLTRERGEDAIHVTIMDRVLTRKVWDKVVYRTRSALTNTQAAVRLADAYLADHAHHCPCCGALMVERPLRGGAVLVCSADPGCHTTQETCR